MFNRFRAGAVALLISASQAFAGSGYDLVMSAETSGANPVPAGSVSYWDMSVTNDGPLASEPATARFTVPSGIGLTDLASVSGFTSCQISGTVATCVVPSLPVDAVASVRIGINASQTGVIPITAEVLGGDDQSGNDIVTDILTVTTGSDLSAVISGDLTATSGGPVSWSVAVSNAGPNALETGRLVLPSVSGVSQTVLPSGCLPSGSGIVCDLPPIPMGGSVSFPFSGIVSAGGDSTITIVAGAVADDPADGNTENSNTSHNVTVLPGSDISITKRREPASPVPVGASVVFALNAYYTGEAPGQVTVTDNVPAGYVVNSVSGAGWNCSHTGNSVSCTAPGTGSAGSLVSLGRIDIQATAIQAGAPVNTASVASSSGVGVTDPNTFNNTATDGGSLIVPQQIDLAANKSGPTPAFVTEGQGYDFRLRSSNVGNTAYHGDMRITDFVPAGMELTGANLNGWSCPTPLPVSGPVSFQCVRTIPESSPLNPGDYAPDLILTMTARTDGQIVNRMRIDAENGNLPDERQGNNESTWGVGGNTTDRAADVSVTKSATPGTVIVGETLTFDIGLNNLGPGVATNVELTDELAQLLNTSEGATDAGIISYGFVGPAPAGATCQISATSSENATLSCAVPSLAVCVPGVDCPVIRVVTRPGHNTAARNNIVSVISRDIADPNYGNNQATASYTVSPRVDMTVSKNVTPTTTGAGQAVIWTIAATNIDNDLSSATNVRVRDVLPHDLTIVSVTPSGSGSCGTRPANNSLTGPGNDVIECTFPEISNASQQTVVVVARPGLSLRGQTIRNSVSVSSDTTDLDESNHEAHADLTISDPTLDLVAGITVSPGVLPMGDPAVWRATLANAGPSAAERASMVITLPVGVVFRSVLDTGGGVCVSPPNGTAGGVVTCSFPYVAPGATMAVRVQTDGAVKGVHQAGVSVSSDEVVSGRDINVSNNTNSRQVTIRTRVNLGVTKASDIPTPGLMQPFNWIVTLTNPTGPGLSEAENVSLIDTIPAGLVLNGPPQATILQGSASLNSCVTSGQTGVLCRFGEVSAGSRIAVTIPVIANVACAGNGACAPIQRTNTARVTTDSYDTDSTNNVASATASVTTSSISGRVFRDFGNDGSFAGNDTGIQNQSVTVTGVSGAGAGISVTVLTDSSGRYLVGTLPSGTYRINTVWSEAFLQDHAARPSIGTASGNSAIVNVALGHADALVSENFSAVPTARVGIAKNVSTAISHTGSGIYRVGFRMTVRNLSLEPLTSLSITDSLAGAYRKFGTYDAGLTSQGTYRIQSATGTGGCARRAAWNGSSDTLLTSGSTLAIGATCTVTVTVDFRPPQPLPAAGRTNATWENQASVSANGQWTGQTPGGNPLLSDLSHNGTTVDANNNGRADDETGLTAGSIRISPAVTLSKRVSGVSFTDQAAIGDTVSYVFTVTNTGNAPLYGVTVTDANATLAGGPIPILQPGASDSSTFTATHVVTSQDIVAGTILNRATVSGVYATGYSATAQSTNQAGVAGNTAVVLAGISVDKTATVPVKDHQPGDVISFPISFTNTGESALLDIVITDPLPRISVPSPGAAALAPGATRTVTATYELDQADIDRGYVDNSVTVTGRYGFDGAGVARTVSGTDTVRATLRVNPSVTLIKTGTLESADPQSAGVGRVRWEFLVRNTGNVTLRDVTLTDPDGGTPISVSPVAVLEPGAESTVWASSRALTQSEIDAGVAINSASVSATPPVGAQVSDVSGTAAGNDTPTRVPVRQFPDLTFAKSIVTGPSSTPRVGEALVFGFTVTNTGNTTLSSVTLSDALPGAVIQGPNGFSLAPGQTATATTARYVLTQDDIERGRIDNDASVIASAPGVTGPGSVTKESQAGADLPASPSFTVTKTAPATAVRRAGEQALWNIAVRNTGNVVLPSVALTDVNATLSSGTVGPIDPGQTIMVQASTVLTQLQVDSGSVSNTVNAAATWTRGSETVTMDESSSATMTITPDPALSMVKSASVDLLSSPPQPDDTVLFGFVLTNSGNVTLRDIDLTDHLAGVNLSAPTVVSLIPGESFLGWTGTYPITQSDIDAGGGTNSATANGFSPSGAPVTANAATGFTIGRSPQISLSKVPDLSGLSASPLAGETVVWNFEVSNTGNTVLTNVSLSESLPGAALDAPVIARLNPGESVSTWSASYDLTQSDIDRGSITNSATATGTSPVGVVSQPASVTSTLARSPSVSLEKTDDVSGLSQPPVAGERIAYSFVATNTGNVTLDGVSLSEGLAGVSLSAPPVPTLAPGERVTAWSAEYVLTQADIDNGFVLNDASVTANFGPDIVGDDSFVRTEIERVSAVSITKTPDTSGLSANPRAGETVFWRFGVRNLGNVTLNDLALTDSLAGVVVNAPVIGELLPGHSDTSWSASYVLRQPDIDRGSLRNPAEVSGTWAGGDVNDTTESVVPMSANPSLMLTKSAVTSGLSSPPVEGEEVTFRFLVRNNGNVTISAPVVTDLLPAVSVDPHNVVSLAPGEDFEIGSLPYALTLHDIESGSLRNDATVTGSFEGDDVTATGGVTVPLTISPSVTLSKTFDDSGLSDPPEAGETVSYEFVATNTGNVTLTGVSLSDPMPGLNLTTIPAASLLPGLSVTWNATYDLTQDDIDAGVVSNLASVSASSVGGAVSTNDSATLTLSGVPGVSVVKSSDLSGLSAFPTEGEIVTYGFAVTNTGNVTLRNFSLTDDLPGISLNAPMIIEIAPGDSDTSWTGSYALTQDDIDRGFLLNEASVSATTPSGGSVTGADSDRAALNRGPAIGLTKTADGSALSDPPEAGEEVRYTFEVTNTGNVTVDTIDLADAMPGLRLTAPVVARLAPGMSFSGWSGVYDLTQSDIDAGVVSNTASASGTSPLGPVSTTDTENLTIRRSPEVSVIKTADPSGLGSPPLAGEEMGYGFEVTNTGNTTLTGLSLTEALAGVDLDAPVIATLLPGESRNVWSGTYALSQTDVDRGTLLNTATVNASSPTGPVSGDDSVVSTLIMRSGMSFTKTADLSGLSSPPRAGDEILYGFEVTNTGNVTLTGVTLSDPIAGVSVDAPVIAEILPGDTDASWTATYELTQADINSGTFRNEATASAGSPAGPVTAFDEEVSVIARSPQISLSKAADLSGLSTPPAPGDVVSFGFVATNDGNVTLSGIGLSDPMPGLTLAAPAVGTLEPGDSVTTWSGTYELTRRDIENGTITNTATVESWFGADPVTNVATSVSTIGRAPEVSLTKTADLSMLSNPPEIGDLVSWSFLVRNEGNVALTGLALTDTMPGIDIQAPVIATLEPGEEDRAWAASYRLTQDDIDAGEILNEASVSATSSGGDASDVAISRSVLSRSGSVSAEKVSDLSALSSPPAEGDVVTYHVEVTNTGNVTLSGIALRDLMPGVTLTGGSASLEPLGSSVWSGMHRLTQADIDSGTLRNVVEVTGTTPSGDVSTTAEVTDPLTGAGGITLEKTADVSGLSEPPVAGDIVRYGFTVTNRGNVTLSGVTLTDAMEGVVISAPAVASLAPGQSHTLWTGTYALKQSDLDLGSVTNEASVTAGAPSGPVSADAEVTVRLSAAPSVSLLKTIDQGSVPEIASAGDIVRFIYVVTNTGNVTLRNVVLTDPATGMVLESDLRDLAPGESVTVTGSYPLTQADIDAGTVGGPASVRADGDCAGCAEVVADSEAFGPISRTPAIGLVKTADVSGLSRPVEAGQRVIYAFEVTNTGNVTLTDVRLRDEMPGLSLDAPVIPSLAPGESYAAWSGARVITEDDYRQTSLRNTATAIGVSPFGDTVSDVSGDALSNDDPTVITLVPPEGYRIVATKTASVRTVVTGDSVGYEISMRNETGYQALDVSFVDDLPAGVVYEPGSARIGERASDPVISGRSLRWSGISIADGDTVKVRFRARITAAASDGDIVNRAWSEDRSGTRVSNVAQAVVRREAEHVFECTDVIGKVWEDRNGNGRQDEGEPGVANARLVTLDGLSIRTDNAGRYSVPCAALPRSGGSTFLIKLDERSLPAGYSAAGRNPMDVRVTPGKAVRINFPVSSGTAHAVTVRVGSGSLRDPAFASGMSRALSGLRGDATVSLVWERRAGESDADVRSGLRAASDIVRKAARAAGARVTITTGVTR